jgi:hypothetical protein
LIDRILPISLFPAFLYTHDQRVAVHITNALITPRSNANPKYNSLPCPVSPYPSQHRIAHRSACFGGKRIGFTLRAEVFAGVFGVDFEEVVEDDEEYGGAAEEDG